MSNNGFDLDQLDTRGPSDRSAAFVLRHPVTDEPLTYTDANGNARVVTIYMFGAESTIARQKRLELQRGRFAKLMRGKNKVTPEQVDAEHIDTLASLVDVSRPWEGIVWKGQPLECTKNNAALIFRERPWARAQADDFINELSNYLGNSSSGSSASPSGVTDSANA